MTKEKTVRSKKLPAGLYNVFCKKCNEYRGVVVSKLTASRCGCWKCGNKLEVIDK